MQDLGIIAERLSTLHGDVDDIKKALGKLSEAVMKLALVEQQQRHFAGALERAFSAINRMEERIQALERTDAAHKPQIDDAAKWVDRGLMAALGATGMWLAKWFT